jgi:UDPglucose 6-dehydrogenase
MQIGVIGAGVVGSAVISSFKDDVDVLIVDPGREDSVPFLDAIFADMMMICLPTASLEDGSIDMTPFADYLQLLNAGYKGLVVIKSTITPQHLEKFNNDFPKLRLVYFPEFLTEANPLSDMLHPAVHILGGDDLDVYQLDQFIQHHTKIKECPVYKTDIITASLAKYFINTWLATKVLFMNEFYALQQESNSAVEWNEFTNIVSTDKRVGDTHLKVPGPDGELGFGGMCFPKDTAALLEYAKECGIDLGVLRAAVEKNKIIRPLDK